MQVIRWQPYMNHHQYFMWSKVEEIIDRQILFVINTDLIISRKEQGWQPFNVQGINHKILKSLKHGMDIIRNSPDAIHVFQSFFGPNRIYIILIFFALLRGVKVVITAEPYAIDPVGYFREETNVLAKFKVFVRPLLYRFVARLSNIKVARSKLCILAVSNIAVKQFISNGFSPEIVFPFGYFIPRDMTVLKNRKNDSRGLRVIYLGSLLKRKGVDLLLNVFELIEQNGNEISLSLDIFGPGNLDNFLQDRELLTVKYNGTIPPEDAQRVISGYDLLVLPSVHDGWGVVVNEALLQGVPVVVSKRVGASCLIEANGAGLVFGDGTVASLFGAFRSLVINSLEMDKVKSNAKNFDIDKISPATGAKYFVQVMKYHFWKIGERQKLFWDPENENV